MSSVLGYKVKKAKPARRMLVTLAVSAPIIFLIIWLVG
jgi:hypothetical protein